MNGIIDIKDGDLVWGEIQDAPENIVIAPMAYTGPWAPGLPELKNHPDLMFSKPFGVYILKPSEPIAYMYHSTVKETHCYPYTKIERNYGAFKTIDIVTSACKKATAKQKELNKATTLSKEIDYTFGLEYETSLGAIPEEECFAKGLIPLRDGSISGNEYASIVLDGPKGINLVEKHIQLLNEYTAFNKECALHIHFGGFPLNPTMILNLNNLCNVMANKLTPYLHTAAYETDRYKKNGKSYCHINPYCRNFRDLYGWLSEGVPYFGDLSQPHPADPQKTSKWNIHNRYYMCNLINMCFYTGPKTVEFRFLRPTKNVHIIYFWLYILNGLLRFVESYGDRLMSETFLSSLDFEFVIREAYRQNIADAIMESACQLKLIRSMQYKNGDIGGQQIEFEEPFKLNPILL